VFVQRKLILISFILLKSSYSQEENNWLNDEANKVRAETVNKSLFKSFKNKKVLFLG